MITTYIASGPKLAIANRYQAAVSFGFRNARRQRRARLSVDANMFQFSIGRLLAGIALIATGISMQASLFYLPPVPGGNDPLFIMVVWQLGCTLEGAGLMLPFKRFRYGAIAGFVLGFFVGALVLRLLGEFAGQHTPVDPAAESILPATSQQAP